MTARREPKSALDAIEAEEQKDEAPSVAKEREEGRPRLLRPTS